MGTVLRLTCLHFFVGSTAERKRKWKLWGSLSKLVAKRLYSSRKRTDSAFTWHLHLLCFPLLDLSPLSAVIYMLGRIHGLVPVVFLPR